MELVLQVPGSGVSLANKAPNCTWQWIEIPEVIEHCAADTVFGESLQFDVSAAVIPICSFDQTGNAGGNEIFEKDTGRTPPMQTSCKHLYLRHVIENGLFRARGMQTQ